MPDGPALHESFLKIPLAHRGLHEKGSTRLENSIPAFEAAVTHGYGIELDLQLSRDGVAMVFHDYALDRLTGETGAVNARDAEALAATDLNDGAGPIPRLVEVLGLVAGRVPLLIEVKDQDGALGPDIGRLEQALADDLTGYTGPVAVMSFNPHSVARLRELMPGIARGRVTEIFRAEHWGDVREDRRRQLDAIDDLDALGAGFISHGAIDLQEPRVSELKARGTRILTWTIRSAHQEAVAREVAENITFEGYLPDIDG